MDRLTPHPLDLDTPRLVYDTEDLTAMLYHGNGKISIVKMVVVDMIDGNPEIASWADEKVIYIVEDFLEAIRQEYGKYAVMTM